MNRNGKGDTPRKKLSRGKFGIKITIESLARSKKNQVGLLTSR
jgi:hypothetical protein